MADLPPTSPEDLSDFAVVPMVQQVKSRLGYTEMITHIPINQFGGADEQVLYIFYATVFILLAQRFMVCFTAIRWKSTLL